MKVTVTGVLTIALDDGNLLTVNTTGGKCTLGVISDGAVIMATADEVARLIKFAEAYRSSSEPSMDERRARARARRKG